MSPRDIEDDESESNDDSAVSYASDEDDDDDVSPQSWNSSSRSLDVSSIDVVSENQ